MYVNALDAVAAGLIGGMDNDFLHKLPQKRRGQCSATRFLRKADRINEKK